MRSESDKSDEPCVRESDNKKTNILCFYLKNNSRFPLCSLGHMPSPNDGEEVTMCRAVHIVSSERM